MLGVEVLFTIYALRYSSLAQSVEHLTVNQGVAGSSPAGGAKQNHRNSDGFFVAPPAGLEV